MISTLSIAKLVFISALSVSGLQYTSDLSAGLTDEQAISIVRNLLPQERRELLQQILDEVTVETISDIQKTVLDGLAYEAGVKLSGHQKPFC